MLVIVGIGQIHLAELLGGIVAMHFREHADFQAPVGGNANAVEYLGTHGKLAGERVAIAVQILQVRQGTVHPLECAKQWRDHQP